VVNHCTWREESSESLSLLTAGAILSIAESDSQPWRDGVSARSTRSGYRLVLLCFNSLSFIISLSSFNFLNFQLSISSLENLTQIRTVFSLNCGKLIKF
jgi:hypothetical protein